MLVFLIVLTSLHTHLANLADVYQCPRDKLDNFASQAQDGSTSRLISTAALMHAKLYEQCVGCNVASGRCFIKVLHL